MITILKQCQNNKLTEYDWEMYLDFFLFDELIKIDYEFCGKQQKTCLTIFLFFVVL